MPKGPQAPNQKCSQTTGELRPVRAGSPGCVGFKHLLEDTWGLKPRTRMRTTGEADDRKEWVTSEEWSRLGHGRSGWEANLARGTRRGPPRAKTRPGTPRKPTERRFQKGVGRFTQARQTRFPRDPAVPWPRPPRETVSLAAAAWGHAHAVPAQDPRHSVTAACSSWHSLHTVITS